MTTLKKNKNNINRNLNEAKRKLGIKLLNKSSYLFKLNPIKKIQTYMSTLDDKDKRLATILILQSIYYFLHNKKIMRKHFKKHLQYKEFKKNLINDTDNIWIYIMRTINVYFFEHIFNNLNNINNNLNISNDTITHLLNKNNEFLSNLMKDKGYRLYYLLAIYYESAVFYNKPIGSFNPKGLMYGLRTRKCISYFI